MIQIMILCNLSRDLSFRHLLSSISKEELVILFENL